MIHASYDTTTTAISFALYNLAKHRDVQGLVYGEVKSVIDEPKESFKVAELSQLTYLYAVNEETLSLFPPVPFYGRKLWEELKGGNFVYPKYSDVYVSPYLIHRDSDIFPDPSVFNPNRFLGEPKHHRFACVQFSAGKRACIGKKFAFIEIKTLIAKVIMNFKLSLENEQEEVIPTMAIGLSSKDPLKVLFVKRMQKTQ